MIKLQVNSSTHKSSLRKVANHHSYSKEFLCVKNGQGFFVIPLLEIKYFASEGNYVTIFTLDGQSILLSKTLKYFDEQLADNFLRIHQSYLINPKYLRFVDPKHVELQLKGGISLPISRSKKRYIKAYLKSIS